MTDIFAEIRKGDILLHHPYQTFDPVVDFIKQAAKDPECAGDQADTLSCQRQFTDHCSTGTGSREWKTGYQYLVELKARFDEENNIVWAKKLEKAGCHVIYGLVGLKTHSKIALVVQTRRRRYPPICASRNRKL